MEFTGAQLLIHSLKAEDVDTIFGYPGGAVLDIYDELFRSDIRHIRACHEQGAIHAADGYARASGRTGVCLVTSGPGATNTVTGIATAFMDSIPMVVITGQVATHLIGKDSFQEVDIVGITRPCSKHNYLITRAEDIPRIIREAFFIASSGRPGPVLIDIPKNLTTTVVNLNEESPSEICRSTGADCLDGNRIGKAAELIEKACRPVIFAGEGVVQSDSSKLLTDFARKYQIPVTSSLLGVGAFPGSDPLWLGITGLQGMYRANFAAGYCDLLIAAGVNLENFVNRKTNMFSSGADIIHMDVDPVSKCSGASLTVPVSGCCRQTIDLLDQMMGGASGHRKLRQKHRPWLDRIFKWNYSPPPPFGKSNEITPRKVVETIHRLTRGTAMITTESTPLRMETAQHYRFDRPGSFLPSGGFDCMGFSLPAAVGAQAACPDRTVICLTETAGFQMTLQEIATAVQYNLPLKIVVFNYHHKNLNPSRRLERHQWALNHGPDLLKLAQAYGAHGIRAEKAEDIETVLRDGLFNSGTVVMDLPVREVETHDWKFNEPACRLEKKSLPEYTQLR